MKSKLDTNSARTLKINETKHAINGGHGDVDLTPREFDLLTCLVDHAGDPLTRTELLSTAWEWDNAAELKTKTVDMHIRRLRMKFEQAGIDPKHISTIRGRGYAYIA